MAEGSPALSARPDSRRTGIPSRTESAKGLASYGGTGPASGNSCRQVSFPQCSSASRAACGGCPVPLRGPLNHGCRAPKRRAPLLSSPLAVFPPSPLSQVKHAFAFLGFAGTQDRHVGACESRVVARDYHVGTCASRVIACNRHVIARNTPVSTTIGIYNVLECV